MFLVYPVKSASRDSLRWQLLFAGIQDYESLKMLEKRLAERAGSAGSSDLVQNYQRRLAAAVTLATTDEDPPLNSHESNLRKARLQINRILKELS